MTKLSRAILAAMVSLLLASSAQAISLTPSTASCSTIGAPCLLLTGTDSSESAARAAIAAALGTTSAEFEAMLFYKSTQSDAAESGPWKDYYSTSYLGTPSAFARISWDGSPDPFIVADPAYAYIKDGNLGWYFFDITGWNGMEDVVFSGFFGGNQGKISHVSLYGTESQRDVPDGGSMAMLLGMAVAGLAGFRRMLK